MDAQHRANRRIDHPTSSYWAFYDDRHQVAHGLWIRWPRWCVQLSSRVLISSTCPACPSPAPRPWYPRDLQLSRLYSPEITAASVACVCLPKKLSMRGYSQIITPCRGQPRATAHKEAARRALTCLLQHLGQKQGLNGRDIAIVLDICRKFIHRLAKTGRGRVR